MNKIVSLVIIGLIVLYVGVASGKIQDNFGFFDTIINNSSDSPQSVKPESKNTDTVKVVSEESVVVEIVENVNPSVVTIGIEREEQILQFDPTDPFGFFSRPRRNSTGKTEEADIGSGFIVEDNGLIVTNKHVVSDPDARYKVITSDNKSFDVTNIYRDPSNDIAIIKIAASGLKPVIMGDSENIKVGQMVIAMGTPLGQFRGSVTKGIVSGLGRGITAGSPLEGIAEELDGVIQTDAAINPGNSGGPLIDAAGQVIGVNTAIASGAENIGFALPINLIKEAIATFQKTGSFDRAFLGISYKMIDKKTGIMYDIPEGAYIEDVVENAAAEKAGLQGGDVITEFDGTRLKGSDNLSKLINSKKIGDSVAITYYRDGEERKTTAVLQKAQ